MSITPSFTPVPVRPRRDGWTPARQAEFVAALAETRCVVAAARTVGMSWQTAYRLRARPDAGSFAAAWDRAVAGPPLDRVFTGRALGGTATPITYRGRRIGERRRYDNRLAIYLLRIRLPARYGKARDERPPRRDSAEAAFRALATLKADLAASLAFCDRDDFTGDVARTSSPSAPALPADRRPRPAYHSGGSGRAPPSSAPVHPRVRRGP